MTIAEILKTKFFPNSSTARLDVELLLELALKRPRSFLYGHPEYTLTKAQQKKFDGLFKRRLSGEPIAYILGKKEFWLHEFKINKNVLIPRPETEKLVEIALEKLGNEVALVADLGTGSGAIAIALAAARPQWKIIATDISSKALKVAHYNAKKLKLKNIKFCCGDWCAILPSIKFDLIVSNPPYIALNDPHLQQGDVRFEPKIALTARDGLESLEKIITQAKKYLKKDGFLVLEHGYNQSKKVQKLLRKNKYQEITVYKDLAGIDRVVVARV
jgi:release factor glutamine methyltransferase